MSADTHQGYIVEIIDPATGCIVYDTAVRDLSKVCNVLDLDPADMGPGAYHEFDEPEMALMMGALGIEYAAIRLPGALRPWGPLDQLPYKVHTNRELVMMLAGE